MPDCRISTGNCEIAIKTSHLPAEISQSATYIQDEEEREIFSFYWSMSEFKMNFHKLLNKKFSGGLDDYIGNN